MNKIYFISRKKGKGKSIEVIFEQLYAKIKANGINTELLEVPLNGVSLKAIWKNVRFISKLKGIIHITGDIHYVCIWPFGVKVLTIHDIGLIRKGNVFSKFFKKLLWLWIPSLTVKKITVVSEYTRQDILKYIPWASAKVEVIPNAIGDQFTFHPKNFEEKCPVILHIGTNENKNLQRTVSALSGIKCKLVIVGTLDQKQQHHLKENEINYENLYNLSNEEIVNLYRKADIISFISLFEGFGMPIIEGNKTGRVIITSRSGSIPEVAKDAVHFVDPLNIEDMKNGFLQLIQNKEYRDELISKGIENVKRFDSEHIVNKYIHLYQQLGLNS